MAHVSVLGVVHFATIGILANLAGAAAFCEDRATAGEVLKGWDLTGQTHVITGGDRGGGIGYEIASALASANATVVLGSRANARAAANIVEQLTAQTRNPRLSMLHLDLSSFASVRHFAAEIRRKYPGVHGVVWNAGILSDPEGLPAFTEDGFDRTFQVNFLGQFALVEELLPLLRHSRGRVVHVSDIAAWSACVFANLANSCTELDEIQRSATTRTFAGENTLGQPASNYGLTKYLQVFHAAELARRENGTVTSYSLHPGSVMTKLPEHLSFSRICHNEPLCPLSPAQGATTPTYLAAAPAERLRDGNGAYFHNCRVEHSVRDQMVLQYGKEKTLEHQRALYDMALGWTRRRLGDASSIAKGKPTGSTATVGATDGGDADGHPLEGVTAFDLLYVAPPTLLLALAVYYGFKRYARMRKRERICEEVVREVESQLTDYVQVATPRHTKSSTLSF